MLYQLKNLKSRAATFENQEALPGEGGKSQDGRKGAPCIEGFKDKETRNLLETKGPGMIRHMWITIPPNDIMAMRNIILRIFWDGQSQPSVESPIGDFFGVAHGRQRSLVSDNVTMQGAKGFNCWIPMPFASNVKITVENDTGKEVPLFFYQIDFTLGDEIDTNMGYFHAQFRRANPCPFHEDYRIIDGIEGKGVYLGTVLGVRSKFIDEWWGEGEVKFYIDKDQEYPTICGTGAEDYIGSAWGLEEINTPYQGAPLVDDERGLYSLYRFHNVDPIYFQESLKVTIQQIGYGQSEKAEKHYGENYVWHRAAGTKESSPDGYFERSDDYSSVAYWYQTLPTNTFPQLPDRTKRSEDLMINEAEEQIERNDL